MDSIDGQLVGGSYDDCGSIPLQFVCNSVHRLYFCVGGTVVGAGHQDVVLLQGVGQDLLELRHKQLVIWSTEANHALKAT